ncbi:seven transmembrane protein 1-like [Canna indica]|uniref:Seven transmembrane protein 1-like n=1 Tax=Canna indica TaxID=4628 RepID=A0AAQ3L3T2_9LILI|nr:seven transmembrane protein 1-like [Canna indica]
MGYFEASPPVCLSNQNCSDWARIYLSYCLCTAKDGMALFLGIASIISWGIAEVPQIITNYRDKSNDGLSVAFLITWIIGDLFNLIGCLLEPATLPTQYYVALLYMVTTLILTGQTIYYGHIYHRVKANRNTIMDMSHKHFKEDASVQESLLGDAKKSTFGGDQANGGKLDIPSSAIPVARHDSSGRDFYYMSARSLSSSPVPAFHTWLAHSPDSGRITPIISDQQSVAREPLLSTQSSPTKFDTKNVLSVVPSAAFFICIFIYHISVSNVHTASDGMVILVGRKLLQDNNQDVESSIAGTLLGWAMAAIYMGGRLPQICLNIKKGNVQGLNPFMFIFALIGNTTYVGSIIVKSLDWSTIKPNLPWLVDAGGCVLLDAFILVQFVYYYFRELKKSGSKDNSV